MVFLTRLRRWTILGFLTVFDFLVLPWVSSLIVEIIDIKGSRELIQLAPKAYMPIIGFVAMAIAIPSIGLTAP
jgi:hypothetical protein